MRCFVCRELIQSINSHYTVFNNTTPKEVMEIGEHFTISLSRTPDKKLFFHVDCFEGSAGKQFTEAIENTDKRCLMCLENEPRTEQVYGKPRRGRICDECSKLAPMCNLCNVKMTLKFSYQNNGLFFSCPKFPACKNSKSVI